MYLYSYLLGDSVMLLIWLLLFIWRKDVRWVMWWLSFLFGFAGVIFEYFYTIDWWRPLTITHTRIGLEDYLFGFWIAGIAAVIYEEVFKKKVYLRKPRKETQLIELTLFIVSLIGGTFVGTFYLLHFNSYWASVAGIVPAILFIWITRPDLIPDSIMTALLLVPIGYLWFWIPEWVTPGWVHHYWMLQNLSGIIILKAPVEDLTWGLLVGAFVGPVYEMWQGAKLVAYKNMPKKGKKKR